MRYARRQFSSFIQASVVGNKVILMAPWSRDWKMTDKQNRSTRLWGINLVWMTSTDINEDVIAVISRGNSFPNLTAEEDIHRHEQRKIWRGDGDDTCNFPCDCQMACHAKCRWIRGVAKDSRCQNSMGPRMGLVVNYKVPTFRRPIGETKLQSRKVTSAMGCISSRRWCWRRSLHDKIMSCWQIQCRVTYKFCINAAKSTCGR